MMFSSPPVTSCDDVRASKTSLLEYKRIQIKALRQNEYLKLSNELPTLWHRLNLLGASVPHDEELFKYYSWQICTSEPDLSNNNFRKERRSDARRSCWDDGFGEKKKRSSGVFERGTSDLVLPQRRVYRTDSIGSTSSLKSRYILFLFLKKQTLQNIWIEN